MITPRLAAAIQFHSLDREIIKTVVDKFIVELQAQLDDKKVHLNISNEARDLIAALGYDEKMGARPMARVIQEKLKKPLAEEVLFGALAAHGGEVDVDVENGEIVIRVAEEALT